jgi:integrase
MSLTKLPSGRWRAQVYDHRTGKNISVGKVLGLKDSTFETKKEAKAAREDARKLLGTVVRQAVTVQDFADRWTSDPIFERPKASTNIHNAERIKGFVAAYGSLPLNLVTDEVVAEWLAGARRNGTVPALRAMFNDARSAKAGRLVDRNPFSELGLKKSKGNAEKDPPSEDVVWALIDKARELTLPSFAAWLQVACFTGMRPGELDALRWSAVDFERGRIKVNEQWSAGSRTFTLPKNGLKRVAVMTPHARDALLALPRTSSPFCFVTSRNSHWTPGARAYHWNAVRAAVGYTDTLYLASRHFAGWHMTNVLGLDSEIVAIALGHEDGGELVRKLYGHRDRRAALDQVARAYEGAAVVPLRVVKEEA